MQEHIKLNAYMKGNCYEEFTIMYLIHKTHKWVSPISFYICLCCTLHQEVTGLTVNIMKEGSINSCNSTYRNKLCDNQ